MTLTKRPGPNTSVALTDEEIEFINRAFGGSKSAAIHAALGALMRQSGESRENVAVKQSRRRGDWLVYDESLGHARRQYGRFETREAAEQYAVELRKSMMHRDLIAAEAWLRPASAASIDPHTHPAFRLMRVEGNEGWRDFEGRVFAAMGAPDFRAGWAGSEQIVEERYESPYLFGRLLRQLVEDDHAPIFRYGHIYFCLGVFSTSAAFYDPTRRDGADDGMPVADWFAATDELAAKPDGETEA